MLEGRLADAQTELDAADAQLASTRGRLVEARKRVTRLRERLAEVREKLSGLLRERYMGDRPDFVTVVLHADGFPQLLETLSFVRRVERADTRLLGLVRSARVEAGREQPALRRAGRRAANARPTAVRARRDALAGITAGLRERRELVAPRPRRAHRRARPRPHRPPQRRARARRGCSPPAPAPPRSSGPGGPWAIPWPIVQCESGGQNTPPNSAGASGYYQFMRHDLEGPRRLDPARLPGAPRPSRTGSRRGCGRAARGAHNWVCASLVDEV